MHVAAAVGCPTVGIFPFQSDFPERWAPLGRRVEVVRASYPCHDGDTKESCRDYACIANLDVPRILSAVAALSLVMQATIQLCTYNRARAARHACSRRASIKASTRAPTKSCWSTTARPTTRRASSRKLAAVRACAFTVVTQANAGLARARNAGIARSTGERIIFIDDDVLPLPELRRSSICASGAAPPRRDRARRRDRGRRVSTICRRRSGASRTTAATTSGRPTSRCRCATIRAHRRIRRIVFASTAGKTSTSACACAPPACARFSIRTRSSITSSRGRARRASRRWSRRRARKRGPRCICAPSSALARRISPPESIRCSAASTRVLRRSRISTERFRAAARRPRRATASSTAASCAPRERLRTRPTSANSERALRAVRILLSRTDRIGDLIFSTPAIATVRASFPDAHVTIVTSEYNGVVVERNDDVDELIVLPQRRRSARVRRSAARLRCGDCARAARRRSAARRRDARSVARRLHLRAALVRAAHRAALRQPRHDLGSRSRTLRSRSATASSGTKSCNCSIWSRSPARPTRPDAALGRHRRGPSVGARSCRPTRSCSISDAAGSRTGSTLRGTLAIVRAARRARAGRDHLRARLRGAGAGVRSAAARCAPVARPALPSVGGGVRAGARGRDGRYRCDARRKRRRKADRRRVRTSLLSAQLAGMVAVWRAARRSYESRLEPMHASIARFRDEIVGGVAGLMHG